MTENGSFWVSMHPLNTNDGYSNGFGYTFSEDPLYKNYNGQIQYNYCKQCIYYSNRRSSVFHYQQYFDSVKIEIHHHFFYCKARDQKLLYREITNYKTSVNQSQTHLDGIRTPIAGMVVNHADNVFTFMIQYSNVILSPYFFASLDEHAYTYIGHVFLTTECVKYINKIGYEKWQCNQSERQIIDINITNNEKPKGKKMSIGQSYNLKRLKRKLDSEMVLLDTKYSIWK